VPPTGASLRELLLVAGIQLMRQMIGLPALTGASREDLARLLAPMFQQLVVGDERPAADADGDG
jgi:hypothetical protein